MIIKNERVYDVLKWIQRVAIPALITFYGVLAVRLNIPYTETVLAIAAAFDTLLGTLLGIDQINYNRIKEQEKSNDGSEE